MKERIGRTSMALTRWIGTPTSIVVHTIVFAAAFALPFFGFAFETVLLVLTTAVSLEAIYLAIFIQMTVNRASESLEEVEADIDEIQEDVEELEEDVEEISEDIDKMEEHEYTEEQRSEATFKSVEDGLQKLLREVESLKRDRHQ